MNLFKLLVLFGLSMKADIALCQNTLNLLNAPESIVYDGAHFRYLLSNYATGDIVQIDNTGNKSLFVEDANAIQGLEIVGNVVYVGARNSVLGFDLRTRNLTMNILVKGVTNLNDITADNVGNLFLSDVFGTKIIKVNISDHTYSVFVDGNGIKQPNGIVYDKKNNRILVCSFRENSPIQAINLADSSVSTLVDTKIGLCDGIALDSFGRCYVTSWTTRSIYRFDINFLKPPELFYKLPCGPADISFNDTHNVLAVPLMDCNGYKLIPIND